MSWLFIDEAPFFGLSVVRTFLKLQRGWWRMQSTSPSCSVVSPLRSSPSTCSAVLRTDASLSRYESQGSNWNLVQLQAQNLKVYQGGVWLTSSSRSKFTKISFWHLPVQRNELNWMSDMNNICCNCMYTYYPMPMESRELHSKSIAAFIFVWTVPLRFCSGSGFHVFTYLPQMTSTLHHKYLFCKSYCCFRHFNILFFDDAFQYCMKIH